MRSPILMALLLASLSDEQLREIAAAHAKERQCSCLPKVREPVVDGKCWNCGKPVQP